MKTRSLLLLICILFTGVRMTAAQEEYLWPIQDEEKYGRYLTSAFAEYRLDRFHAAIDIKTIWRDGHKVVAVSDGYVMRLRTSPVGYGRAVYLRLKDGKIAVYAHLRSFSPALQKFVEEEQEKNIKYTVDLWFPPGTVTVEKGEVLGTTGRSGTRLQHLHFELRDSKNRPINPLENGFSDDDILAPRPARVSFRPINGKSSVDGDWTPLIRRLDAGQNDVYTLRSPVTVWGDIGVSIDAYDRNGTYDNNYGIYEARLIVNNRERFAVKYDRFGYEQNRLVNIDRDYRFLRRGKGIFQKLYIDEKNGLNFYGDYGTGDGILHFTSADTGMTPFEIILSDNAGNTASVQGEFAVKPYSPTISFPDQPSGRIAVHTEGVPGKSGRQNGSPHPFSVEKDFQNTYLRIVFTSRQKLRSLPAAVIEFESGTGKALEVRAQGRRKFITMVPFADIGDQAVSVILRGSSSTGTYESRISLHLQKIPREGGVVDFPMGMGRVEFSPDDIDRAVWVRTRILEAEDSNHEYAIVGKIVELEPKEAVLRSDVRLSLKYPHDETHPDKLAVYVRNKNGWHYIGHEYTTLSNTISTDLSSLETVAVIRDTTAPAIFHVSPRNGAVVSKTKLAVEVWFDDDLSGIAVEDDMSLSLNGEKVISEWDPILQKVVYMPKNPLPAGTYTAHFMVSDRMKNTAEKEWTFSIRR